jgi:hypothetical protein
MVTVARVEESNAKGNSVIYVIICGGTNIISFSIYSIVKVKDRAVTGTGT